MSRRRVRRPTVTPGRAGALLRAGRAELRDAQLPTLDADWAVFGFGLGIDLPPAWLHQDTEVAARIAGKVDDYLCPQLWWQITELARQCTRLDRPVPPFDTDTTASALRLAGQLAARLARPAARLHPPRLAAACPDDLLACAPDVLADLAARLAEVIEAPWADPAILVGTIDDIRWTLTRYARALELTLPPAPATAQLSYSRPLRPAARDSA